MKSKTKRTLEKAAWIFLFSLTGLTLLALYATNAPQPRFPANWPRIKPGMTRNEAMKHVPDKWLDLRELKGFDTLTYRANFRDSWHIQLRYKCCADTETVREVRIFFIDEYYGPRNIDVTNPDTAFFDKHSKKNKTFSIG